MNRQGHAVARCTVERLMRELGITGAVRQEGDHDDHRFPAAERAPDLLDRDFVASAPNLREGGNTAADALMESTIRLFKTELINPGRPWKTLSQVELATAEWIDWYCHRRLHGEIDRVPPIEYETNHYMQSTKPQVTTTI
jgi:transposase InsO family protein